MAYDVLITGGRVVDPAQDLDALADVALSDGRVAAVGPGLSASEATTRIDATGCLVAPGLVDLHTHVAYRMDALSIEADRYLSTGVTTWVDAGSTGAANFAGFRHYVIEPSQARILPFLNISEPGLTCLEVVHGVIEHLDADSAYRTVEQNRDLIKGIKVLSCAMRVGTTGLKVARAALEQGFPPDVISTDLHISSLRTGAYSLPSVMSKFLHLGMSLREVIRLATAAPAAILGMDGQIGCLRPGASGDVTVLRIESGQFPLEDCEGVTETLSERLVPVCTIRAGQVFSAA